MSAEKCRDLRPWGQIKQDKKAATLERFRMMTGRKGYRRTKNISRETDLSRQS